jgi:hypothetical protein
MSIKNKLRKRTINKWNFKITLLFIMLGFPIICRPQLKQKGRALEKDSNGKPVENVQIIVKDSPPAISDNDGKFELNFRNKLPGEMIFVDSIYKKGYETVNEASVKNWIFSDKNNFSIILCKKGLLKQSREIYYNVGKSRYMAKFNQKFDELAELKKAGRLAEEEFADKLRELNEEKLKAIDQLDYYADIFSRINKDELTKTEAAAFEFAEKGKIDEAIKLYEGEKFLTRFTSNYSLLQSADSDLAEMATPLKRYADLCAFAGGKENYEIAGRCLEAIARSDTGNFDYAFDFAYFMGRQAQYEKAISLFSSALQKAKTFYHKIECLRWLANYYLYGTREIEPAVKFIFLGMLESILHGDFQNSVVLLSYLSEVSNRLGYVSEEINRGGSADRQNTVTVESIIKSFNYFNIKIRNTRNIPQNEKIYIEAGINYETANLYIKDKKFKNADSLLKLSLSMYNRLQNEFSEDHSYELSLALRKLGFVRNSLGSFADAEKSYLEGLAYSKNMTSKNPQARIKDYASNLEEISAFYGYSGRDSLFEKYSSESIQILLQLTNENLAVNGNALADVYFQKGNVYATGKKFQLAEQFYDSTLTLQKKLLKYGQLNDQLIYNNSLLNIGEYFIYYKEDGEKAKQLFSELLDFIKKYNMERFPQFKFAKILAYNDLGRACMLNKNYYSAERNFNYALKELGKIKNVESESHLSATGNSYLLLGIIYIDRGDFDKAESFLKTAEEKFKRLVMLNFTSYNESLSMVYNGMGNIYSQKKDYQSAVSATEKELAIDEKLAAENPQEKTPAIASEYGNLSYYYSFLSQFKLAEDAARKGLEADSTQIWIYTNLAPALLFQGKYEESKKIVLTMKDIEFPFNKDKKFRNIFLDDLSNLEKAGITHPDIEKIRKLLN